MTTKRGKEQCKTCIYLHGGKVLSVDNVGHCYMFEAAPAKNDKCGQFKCVDKIGEKKQ